MIYLIKILRLIFAMFLLFTGVFLILSETTDFTIISFIVTKVVGFLSIYVAMQLHPFNMDNTVKKEGIILTSFALSFVMLIYVLFMFMLR
jgi:uncharacterized membrane-anchored protein